MSPHHFTFGAGAAKSRRSRSANFGAALSWRVNPLRRFGLRPCRPCRRIESATVFTLTVQPASTRSAWIRGEPYVHPDASNAALTAVSSSPRRTWVGVGSRCTHL